MDEAFFQLLRLPLKRPKRLTLLRASEYERIDLHAKEALNSIHNLYFVQIFTSNV